MASAVTPSYSQATTVDESITAQDSEIIKNGVKQTALGNAYTVGDNSTVTDAGAIEMVGNVGSQFLETVANITKGFTNGVLNATNSILTSNAAQNEEAALAAQKNVMELLKYAVVGGAIVAAVYSFNKGSKRK